MKLVKLLLTASMLFFISCGGENNSNNSSVPSYSELERINALNNRCNKRGFSGLDDDQFYKDRMNFHDSLFSMVLNLRPVKRLNKNFLNCAKKAKTCKALDKCYGIKRTETTCNVEDYRSSCDDGVLNTCKDNVVINQNCALRGMKCGTNYSPQPMFIYGLSCYDPDQGESKIKTKCNGENELIVSYGDDELKINCNEYAPGTKCKETSGFISDYFCVAPDSAQSCDKNFRPTCNGNIARTCNRITFGKIIEIDCKKIMGDDYKCDTETNIMIEETIPPCIYDLDLISTEKCSDEDERSCNEGVLTYCVEGRKRSFNCKENGYDSCMEGSCVLKEENIEK